MVVIPIVHVFKPNICLHPTKVKVSGVTDSTIVDAVKVGVEKFILLKQLWQMAKSVYPVNGPRLI